MVKTWNWMSALEPTRKLVELCLPGSHDAGVYTDEQKGLKPGGMACCQSKNIRKQASEGSRVFDIRCFLKAGTPTMGHFFADTAPLGEYGGTLESALKDALDFLGTSTQEFLIFRIGHTEKACLEKVAEVLERFYNLLENGKLVNASRFFRFAPTGNLADVEVRFLRGKLVLLCDTAFQSAHFKPNDGYFLYDKYSPTSPSTSAQITFCGKYNKENRSPAGAVKNAEDGCQEHNQHRRDHLLWVYWQETGGNVWEHTTARDGMQNRLDNFLSRIRDTKNNLPLPNVIGHDFVNRWTCGAIAKMNKDVNTKLEISAY
ncbi:MAG: hypothetical protein JO069_13535 [Verrucomicrobia bacterium]|nr:hypothetical protein [Verrucomicrobiota bacterium]